MSTENTNTMNNENNTAPAAPSIQAVIEKLLNNAKSTRGRVEARRRKLEAESSKTSAKKTVVTFADTANKEEVRAISLANTWEKLSDLLKKEGVNLSLLLKEPILEVEFGESGEYEVVEID